MDITLSSRAPIECRDALEELLFFNPSQHKVREGILASLEIFGHPRLEEGPEGVLVRVGTQEAQTLFAFDRDRKNSGPVGVIVFLRTCPEDIVVLHVAVHPNYALRKDKTGVGLGLRLVESVKEIASRIVGVKRIVLFYRQEVVIRI